jgi:hypothetical protein
MMLAPLLPLALGIAFMIRAVPRAAIIGRRLSRPAVAGYLPVFDHGWRSLQDGCGTVAMGITTLMQTLSRI